MTAAALVTQGYTLADVGTDHGYIPIYLLQQKKIPAAIAMDINEGPLERAKEHIALYGLQAYIQTRLSDGVAALKPGEVEAVLIAGMGGGLVMHILKDGEKVCQSAKELILQPQSEIERVREFLREKGYTILAEDMVYESAVSGKKCAEGFGKIQCSRIRSSHRRKCGSVETFRSLWWITPAKPPSCVENFS